MGSTASTSHKGKKEECPWWVYTAEIRGDPSSDRFSGMSSGMSMMGPCTVVRSRPMNHDTDGAMWKRGFTEGKHVFEVVYPVGMRGTEACVGVGLADAPLHIKGRVSLVGHNEWSWGLDLRTRRAMHQNKIVKRYPQTQVYLPDKFFMYLDVDSGSLMFGSDFDYYGTAFMELPRGQPLYPMVSSNFPGSNITMCYRGEGTMSGGKSMQAHGIGASLNQLGSKNFCALG